MNTYNQEKTTSGDQTFDPILLPDNSTYQPNSMILGVYQFAAIRLTADTDKDPTAAFVDAMNFLLSSKSSLADATADGGDACVLFTLNNAFKVPILVGWVNRNNREAGWARIQLQPSTASADGTGFVVKCAGSGEFDGGGDIPLTMHWDDISNNNQSIFVNVLAVSGTQDIQYGVSTTRPTGTIGGFFTEIKCGNFQF